MRMWGAGPPTNQPHDLNRAHRYICDPALTNDHTKSLVDVSASECESYYEIFDQTGIAPQWTAESQLGLCFETENVLTGLRGVTFQTGLVNSQYDGICTTADVRCLCGIQPPQAPPLPPLSPPSPMQPQLGYIDMGTTGTWYQARDACLNAGHQMPILQSSAENAALATFLNANTLPRTWLGAF